MASGGPTGTSFQIVSTDADIFDDEAPTSETEENAVVESTTQEACTHKRNMDGLLNEIINQGTTKTIPNILGTL